MSAYDISPGAMSASSRPAWANRLGIRIRLSSYTHTDAPSSSTTWGARSRSALATRSAHSPGGSMTWSSTEMSPSMAGSLRRRPGLVSVLGVARWAQVLHSRRLAMHRALWTTWGSRRRAEALLADDDAVA